MPWLAAKSFLGLARWIWAIVLLAVVVAIYFAVAGAEKADDKANQTIGATAERNTSLEKTLERTEQGNEAREEIRTPTAAGACARFNQCLRSARGDTAASCGRFLPEQSTGFGCPSP